MAEEKEETGKDDKTQPVGIVVTGTEAFGERQGFIPAAEAAKAGLTVTGVTTEEGADAEKADTPAPKATAKRGQRKK